MKISRKELEEIIGRRLEDEEVRKLKRAKRKGIFMRRRWIWKSSRAMISLLAEAGWMVYIDTQLRRVHMRKDT